MHGIAPELNEIEISFLSLEPLAEFSKIKAYYILKYDSSRSSEMGKSGNLGRLGGDNNGELTQPMGTSLCFV